MAKVYEVRDTNKFQEMLQKRVTQNDHKTLVLRAIDQCLKAGAPIEAGGVTQYLLNHGIASRRKPERIAQYWLNGLFNEGLFHTPKVKTIARLIPTGPEPKGETVQLSSGALPESSGFLEEAFKRVLSQVITPPKKVIFDRVGDRRVHKERRVHKDRRLYQTQRA